MSSNAATVTNAPSGLAAVKSSTWGVIIAGVIAISLYITSFVMMSSFVGSKDDWSTIQPQVYKVLGVTIAGSFALSVAALLYYLQDPQKAIYFILAITCLSFGFSYSALAVAVISK